MNHKDLINTCVFELIQGLLFSDLSGPLNLSPSSKFAILIHRTEHNSKISCQFGMYETFKY